ncbi:hypothetical protein [Microbacterium sp. MMO-10]|uniref:hypothetical protein n=1 Tax=Microbacterium sp. MMO-10 TaxID=3081272 RepID=UPI003019B8D6
MSAAILDRARAFDMIAPHLSEEKRAEIASALGDKLLSEIGGPQKPPAAPAAHPNVVDIPKDFDVTTFLVGKGLKDADLVRKTAQAVEWLKSDKCAHLTRDARIQTWWASRAEAS